MRWQSTGRECKNNAYTRGRRDPVCSRYIYVLRIRGADLINNLAKTYSQGNTTNPRARNSRRIWSTEANSQKHVRDNKVITEGGLQWIFLWVVLAEAVALAFAATMRCMGELDQPYDSMEESEAERLRNMEMQSIMNGLPKTKADKAFDKCALTCRDPLSFPFRTSGTGRTWPARIRCPSPGCWVPAGRMQTMNSLQIFLSDVRYRADYKRRWRRGTVATGR